MKKEHGAMKVIFIIPPNIHYIEPYSFVKADKSNTVRPHLGLLYVAAALRKNLGISVRIIDSNKELKLTKFETLFVSPVNTESIDALIS